MRLAHGTPEQPQEAVEQLAKAARLPPCSTRRARWAAEPVHASTTPRLSSAVPSLGHVMLPGSPVIIRGNRQSHSRDPSAFRHRSSPEAPSLRRHYPASQVLRASPPPYRPDTGSSPVQAPALAGCRLARATPPDRASRVASIPLFHACHSNITPAEPVGAYVARFPTGASLPRFRGGSASALRVSRPARRSLTLRPA